MKFIDHHFFTGQRFICHFGGGSPKQASPAPPPVTTKSTEVQAAGRKAAMPKRQRSIFAGETGNGSNQQRDTVG